MTPTHIKTRRIELGLSITELACVLGLTENELLRIEAGDSLYYQSSAFEDAFEALEERVLDTFVGV